MEYCPKGLSRYAGHLLLVLDLGCVLSLEFSTALGLELTQHSSGVFYSPNFRALHALEESHALFFVDDGEVPESYNIPFTISELCFAFALCRDSAAGSDGLSYPFLCHLNPTATEFLLKFVNWIYTSELFPDLWCQSIVIRIPKPCKDHSLPGNFCPISLTSCICKLLE